MNTEIDTRTCEFTRLFPATRHGARLARRLAVGQLAAWGLPYDSEVSGTVAAVVAELAANAVTHGRVAGRDFELRLTLDAHVIRIEVSDARGERLPAAQVQPPPTDVESGRGLLLVQALARAWGTSSREVGKTVWAECALPDALAS
jgi:anti-sigma regulatory factor (Ser/Thr protein kinase)